MQFFFVVIVEVARVSYTLHFGNEGSVKLKKFKFKIFLFSREPTPPHPFLVYCNPIGRRKPSVILDVVDAVLEISESFSEIDLKEIAQEIF